MKGFWRFKQASSSLGEVPPRSSPHFVSLFLSLGLGAHILSGTLLVCFIFLLSRWFGIRFLFKALPSWPSVRLMCCPEQNENLKGFWR